MWYFLFCFALFNFDGGGGMVVGWCICVWCMWAYACLCLYVHKWGQTERIKCLPLLSSSYCLEPWTVAQAVALQLGHTGWPLCYNYLPVFTQSCQGYTICSHAWLFYVDVRDLNSHTHDCTASTLSPWAISPGLVLSVYKEDTYMVHRMPL